MKDDTFDLSIPITFDDDGNFRPSTLDDYPRESLLIDGKVPHYHSLIFNVARSHRPSRNSRIQIIAPKDSELADKIGIEPVIFLVIDVKEDFPRIPANESELILQSLEPAFLTELPR